MVGLTDQFLGKTGMTMPQGLDLTYPVIKTNFVNLSKIAEMDKQLCEAVLDSIFDEIRRTISSGAKEFTIDLSLFGKLRVKDKKIEHVQLEKPKVAPTAPNRKLTIKSLLDKEEKPRKLPKLD